MSAKDREEMRQRLRHRLRHQAQQEVVDLPPGEIKEKEKSTGGMDNLMKNIAIWFVIALVLMTVFNYFGARVVHA